jgi:predicted GIY-YIG superfamily endonuclease
MAGGYIYILGSHTGTLYIGVTSNLYLRTMQHKEGTLVRSIPSSKTLDRDGDGR